jgi:hypothetical protein
MLLCSYTHILIYSYTHILIYSYAYTHSSSEQGGGASHPHRLVFGLVHAAAPQFLAKVEQLRHIYSHTLTHTHTHTH